MKILRMRIGMEKVYLIVQHIIHFQVTCEAQNFRSLTNYIEAKFDKSEENRHYGISYSSL